MARPSQPEHGDSESGVWNLNHVEERYDADVLDLLEAAVEETTAP